MYTLNPDGTYSPLSPTYQTVTTDLSQHIVADESRFNSLEHSVSEIKSSVASLIPNVAALIKHEAVEHFNEKEEKAMAYETPMNIFTNPNGNGGNDGFGMGGGMLGGVILGSLIGGRGGLFGNNGAGVAEVGVPAGNISLATLQAIGDVKASVPLSACEVMGSVSAAAADITSQTLSQTIGLNQNINSAKEAGVAAAFNNSLLLTQGFAQVKDATDSLATQTAVGFGATNLNIERGNWAVSGIVRDEAEKTRLLISSIDRDNLNRQLTVAENALTELRAEGNRRSDRDGIRIEMIQNNNQQQMQMQQQQQAINTLAHCLNDVSQVARATNQAINIGSGTQTSSPVNSATNVKG